MKFTVGEDVVLSRPLEGPLSAHILGFAKWVRDEGYALFSRRRQIRLAACFSRWLGQSGVIVRSISSDHAARYLRSRARHVRIQQGDSAALREFIAFLCRQERARPYLYAAKEIRDLLRAALALPCRDELRPWTYHCLLGLLSVTGLRIGESRNLKIQDVDLKMGVLTVRGAKFGKSRLIPIHPSTRRMLADYLARRDRRWSARPASPYVFLSNWGNQLDGGEIHRTFYALSRQIGLRGPTDRRGPRLHDLRQHADFLIMPTVVD